VADDATVVWLGPDSLTEMQKPFAGIGEGLNR